MGLNATAMVEGKEIGADQCMVQPRADMGEAGQCRETRKSPACAEDPGGFLAHLHEMSAVLVLLGVRGRAVGGVKSAKQVTQGSGMLPTFVLKSPARMTCPDATVAALGCLVSVICLILSCAAAGLRLRVVCSRRLQ